MADQTPNKDAQSGGNAAAGPQNQGASAGGKPSKGRRFMRWVKIGILALVAFLVLTAVAQPVLVLAFRFLPIIILALAGIGGAILVARRWRAGRGPSRRAATLMAVLWLVFTGGVCVTNLTPSIVQWQMAQALHEEALSVLPHSHDSRFVARQTAREYVKNANADNRLKGKEPHLVRQRNADGTTTLWWQSPLAYDIWYGTPLGSVHSVVKVDAGEPNMTVDAKSGKNAFFLFGDESWVTELIFRLRHPFSERGETVYWQKENGEWVMLISYVSYRPTWTLTMVPQVVGVMEVGSRGGFTNHSVDEAKRLFDGAALYPPALARQYAEAYATYHLGYMNTLFAQKELLEISESRDADAENSFPYYQDFEQIGMKLIVPLEPRGGNSFSLSRVLFFDAITGKVKVYTSPADERLNGPRKALLNVHNAAPDADWGEYVEVEPKLVHGKQGTFWLVTVIRKDPSSHAFVMLVAVDMKTLRAYRFDDINHFDSFLENGVVPQAPTK